MKQKLLQRHTIVKRDSGTYWLYRDGKMLICPFHQPSGGQNSNCGSWCPLFQYFNGRVSPKKFQSRVLLHCGNYNADYVVKEAKK